MDRLDYVITYGRGYIKTQCCTCVTHNVVGPRQAWKITEQYVNIVVIMKIMKYDWIYVVVDTKINTLKTECVSR